MMPVTQQDLVEWTQEYRTLRKLNPSLGEFNDWLKDRIINKERTADTQHLPSSRVHAGLNGTTHTQHSVHFSDHQHHHHEQVNAARSPASASPAHAHASRRSTHASPRSISKGIPAHSTSPQRHHSPPHSPQEQASPSPPLITPEQQPHLRPHSHHSTPPPILHPVPAPLRSPSPLSNASTPPLSSSRKSPSPEHVPNSPSLTTLVPQPSQYLQKKEIKTKTIKKRFMSPPRNALFKSLSNSLIFPHGPTPQQMTHVATYDFPFNMQAPSGDMVELKDYLTQFQSKQQNQLFQIFDVVESINSKLSRGTPLHSSPTYALSPSTYHSSPPPTHQRKHKMDKAKQRHMAKPLVLRKEPSPFAAIFSDQISSIRKILQDEYNRTAEDTSYTKKLYQMTKLRRIHQVSVEFLLSLAHKLQLQAQFSPNNQNSDLGLDLGMIISQLAGLNAEMQLKFPFLFGSGGAKGDVGTTHRRKPEDPFAARLAKHTQTSKSSDSTSKDSQTTAVKNEAGSQTKNKETNKRVQTDSSLNNSSFDMAEVNDSIQKISTDTELLKTEFDGLKSVAQASTQAVLKQYNDHHRESNILDKQANKELKDLKSIFTQFLEKFEQVHRDKDERDELDTTIERENRERRQRLDVEEKERKARLEVERLEREERYMRDREEKDRRERRDREERERLDREAREKRDREYRERRDKEEREDRERREREERYKRELEETEKLDREERERIEQEKRSKEERDWNLRVEQERQARMERERRIQEERERREREERGVLERERMIMEQRQREEQQERERARLEIIERVHATKRDRERAEVELRRREELEMEMRERERLEKEGDELARFKRDNAQNWNLLMTTLHDMEKDESSLRHSTHSLLRQTTPPTRSPALEPHHARRVPKPNRGITDRLMDDLCLQNAKEMDGMCGDYLDGLVRLQLDEVLLSPDIDIADLL